MLFFFGLGLFVRVVELESCESVSAEGFLFFLVILVREYINSNSSVPLVTSTVSHCERANQQLNIGAVNRICLTRSETAADDVDDLSEWRPKYECP